MLYTNDIDGVRLHYKSTGEGNPMIIMHGWGCSLETVEMITKTASKTHKVYAIDFPGFGNSPEPPDVWGVEEYTRLLEAFVQSEKIEKPVLLGHSFGGRVGILYSSRNDVEKLILVDAAGIKPRRKLSYYIRVYKFKFDKLKERLLHSKEEALKRIDELRNKRGSSDYRNASPRMRSILSKVVSEDLKYVMPRIKTPTLLIWGENDTATPLGDAKIMEKLIPDAGLVTFPGCGHYSFLDNPRQFSAVLDSFLKS